MNRLAVIARLKEGAADKARQLLTEGPPFDLANSEIISHTVYCSPREIVFVFEGPDVGKRVENLLNNPVTSAQFGKWAHLLDGTPVMAPQQYHWSPEN